MSVPLWAPEDKGQRLSELMGRPEAIKEEPLRRDVRCLGQLLGEIIREQAGTTAFNSVETLRRISIEDRTSPSEAFIRAEHIVSHMSISEAAMLTKAFS